MSAPLLVLKRASELAVVRSSSYEGEHVVGFYFHSLGH